MNNKIEQMIKTLENLFIGRNKQIEAMILALLSKNNCCFISPPGTAKSLMVDALSKLINAKYFSWLIHKFTTPEEIFGPISIKGLENDRFYRITNNKLPEAEIAFIDEIWNAVTILPTLNTILNERIFYNDSNPTICPLISCYSASNTLPQEGEGELLGVFDRFVIRDVFDYLNENYFDEYIDLISNENITEKVKNLKPIISTDEIRKIIEYISNFKINESLRDTIKKIWFELKKEGIKLSDRRWSNSISIIKAKCYIDGCNEPNEDHCESLKFVLWSDIEHIEKVNRVLLSVISPIRQTLIEYLDICEELYNNANDLNSIIEANKGIKDILSKISKIVPRGNKDIELINEYTDKIKNIHQKIVKLALGENL